MMKLINVVSAMLSVIADFLWSPLIRAHIREVALRSPLFPGQFWTLPMLGLVQIKSVTDFHVTYTIESDSDEEEHTCRRSDFVIHAQVPVHDEPEHPGKVIQLNILTKVDK